MSWDWAYAFQVLPSILDGFRVTVLVTVVASIIALALGLVIAFALRGPRPVSMPVRAVVDVVRGSPLLVQVFFWYYAMPALGISADAFVVGVFALGLYGAAYTSVVYLAGINNLDAGQWDAALVLRLPRPIVWRDIVIPQVVRNVLPALGNYVIVMFKYTPILSVITISEAMARALEEGSITFRYVEPLTIVGVLFIAVSVPIAIGLNLLGRRWSRASARLAGAPALQ